MALNTTEEGQVLRQLITARGGSRPIIDSWDYVIRHRLEDIVSSLVTRTADNNRIQFSNLQFTLPSIPTDGSQTRDIYPAECRRRGFTYEASVFVTMSIVVMDPAGRAVILPSDQRICYAGKIPVMILSSLDHNNKLSERERFTMRGEPEKDPGGYFIIGGMEKFINNVEHLRAQYPFLYFDDKLEKPVVRFTSVTVNSTTVNVISEDNNVIKTTFTRIGLSKKWLNIFILFYVLGFTDDPVRDGIGLMERFVTGTGKNVELKRRRLREYLGFTIAAYQLETRGGDIGTIYALLADCFGPAMQTQYNRDAEIQQEIRVGYLQNIPYLKNIPGQNEILFRKLNTMAYMTVKYIMHKLGYRGLDDRDSWGNKRLETAGLCFEAKFTEIWKAILRELSTDIIKHNRTRPDEIKNLIRYELMGKEFRDAFTKGTWSKRDIAITESLKRDTHLATIANIRRITTPTNRRANIPEKRMIHLTQWNVICPASTPEGENCGLVKDPAISIYISHQRKEAPILAQMNGLYFNLPSIGIDSSLFVNGAHIGFCNGETLYNRLLALRRSQQIYFDTMILYNEYNEIHISTTAGRLVVPYFIVDEETQELVMDKKKLRGADVDTLLKAGAIEYVDSEEQLQKNMLIARTLDDLQTFREDRLNAQERYNEAIAQNASPEELRALTAAANQMKYTHSIIDPSSMFGVSASIMPYLAHNPIARVTYQSSMAKQALGLDSSRVSLRFDTNVRTMVMPDVPLIATDMHEQFGLDKYSAGTTMIIAILARGRNQEDAVSINRGAKLRGLSMMNNHHSYKVVLKKAKGIIKKLGIPTTNNPMKADRYSKLDPATGIVRVGLYVYTDDCLIGVTTTDETTGSVRDSSTYVDIGKEGVVEEVFHTINAESQTMITVRIRETKSPEVGDKLASRYSQKGVVGEEIPEEEMPFIVSKNKSLNGIRPDIIFNPHGIPSRMTIGKLMEILASKVALAKGERINATAYRKAGMTNIRESLAEIGFSRSGLETMIDGRTGRTLEVEVFTGAIYYQLLRHLVKYKMQARGTGPSQFLTRQPVAGIRRLGGLRFGEMERDALIAAGATQVMRERLMISSDKTKVIACGNCGLFVNPDLYNPGFQCELCKEQAQPHELTVPYPYVLLSRYLAALNYKVSAKLAPVVK